MISSTLAFIIFIIAFILGVIIARSFNNNSGNNYDLVEDKNETIIRLDKELKIARDTIGKYKHTFGVEEKELSSVKYTNMYEISSLKEALVDRDDTIELLRIRYKSLLETIMVLYTELDGEKYDTGINIDMLTANKYIMEFPSISSIIFSKERVLNSKILTKIKSLKAKTKYLNPDNPTKMTKDDLENIIHEFICKYQKDNNITVKGMVLEVTNENITFYRSPEVGYNERIIAGKTKITTINL